MSGLPGAVLYTRAGCPLCFALGRLAERSSRRHRVDLVEVDVDAAPELAERYGERVPVLELPGGRSISGRAGALEIDEAFGRAASFVRGLGGDAPAAGRPPAEGGLGRLWRALGPGRRRKGDGTA